MKLIKVKTSDAGIRSLATDFMNALFRDGKAQMKSKNFTGNGQVFISGKLYYGANDQRFLEIKVGSRVVFDKMISAIPLDMIRKAIAEILREYL